MKRLSETEFKIMKILWEHPEPVTSSQILEETRGELDWKLASLMTALSRMADKGYVHCDRSTRTNYYRAVISREDYRIQESDSFLAKLYDRSATKFIASLCRRERMSGEEMPRSSRMPEQHGREDQSNVSQGSRKRGKTEGERRK